jgi:hypothetical protein
MTWPFPPFPNPLDKPGQPDAPAKFDPKEDDYEQAPY